MDGALLLFILSETQCTADKTRYILCLQSRRSSDKILREASGWRGWLCWCCCKKKPCKVIHYWKYKLLWGCQRPKWSNGAEPTPTTQMCRYNRTERKAKEAKLWIKYLCHSAISSVLYAIFHSESGRGSDQGGCLTAAVLSCGSI